MNLVSLVGLFMLPRALPRRPAAVVKVLGLVMGVALFLYANYGGGLTVHPEPSSVIGPIATITLSDATTLP